MQCEIQLIIQSLVTWEISFYDLTFYDNLSFIFSNTSGVSEEALREFSMMFKHFDKDKSGRLDHHEFKSCLRALGYDLPMVEEGQRDPEFEAILDTVDPNR